MREKSVRDANKPAYSRYDGKTKRPLRNLKKVYSSWSAYSNVEMGESQTKVESCFWFLMVLKLELRGLYSINALEFHVKRI